MNKFKICPSCKTENSPIAIECMNCETDLTNVKITDQETEKMLEENKTSDSTDNVELFRICDCGTKNPPNARKCLSCGEEISDITPTPIKAGFLNKIEFLLSSVDGKFVYRIENDEILIGRENILSEYLFDKNYVSRLHAKITMQNDELFIENLSSTNFTYINNQKILDKTSLKDNDEIGLGGNKINEKRQDEAAYFIVKVKPCI